MIIRLEDARIPCRAHRPGERVWAYDHEAGDWRSCQVVECFENDYQSDLITINIDGAAIEATAKRSRAVARAWLFAALSEADNPRSE
jgi:hypothetical protein